MSRAFSNLGHQLRPRMRTITAVFLTLIAFTPASLFAAGMTIGAGDAFSLDTGSVDLGCGDLIINGELNLDSGTFNNVDNVIINNGGTLNGNSGTINLSGDWTNNGGTTNPGSSQVTFNTDCSSDTINVVGDSSFWNLTLQTTTGRQITFEAGSTTTVNGHLILNGLGDENNPVNLLKIRSSSPGNPAFLIVNGTYVVNQVDVSDNHALLPGEWIDFGPPEDFDSIDGPGNFRWFRSGADVGQLTFRVTKEFNDGNPGSVTVRLSCNTGLILDQVKVITSNTPVTFVLASIDATEVGPNCRVWEETEAGYEASYAIPYCNEFTGSCTAVNSGDEPGCFYEDAHPREGSEENECNITNTLQPVQFTIFKEWLFEGQPNLDVETEANIELSCNNTALDSQSYWNYNLYGNDSVTTEIYPRWQGNTVCSVTENLYLSGIESDGCDGAYGFEPGDAPSECTITNTVYYEGIPTLSQWGMALMVLLMLGMGLVSFRRFV